MMKKERVKKVKPQKDHIKISVTGRIFGIRTKLVGAFLIPVVLIILLGNLSTQKASEVIIQNYKEATMNTVRKTGEYYDLLLKTVAAKSQELAESREIRNYYGGVYADSSVKDGDVYNQISGEAKALVESDPNINVACVLSSYGRSISTTAALPAGKYEELLATEDGQNIIEANGEAVWSGYHKIVDEALMLKDSQYGLSVSRVVISNQMQPVAAVTMDVAMEALQTPLAGIDLPEGSICAFVTPDGREITQNGENSEDVFFGQSFYSDALSGTDMTGIRELTYQENEYLYLYSKIGTSDSMICAIIPEAIFAEQTAGIKDLTNMMVGIAIVIAVVVGLLLAAGIGSAINKMNKLVKKAEEGDLTVRAVTRRKDEFGILAKHVSGMLSGMKTLIQRAANVAYSIIDLSKVVSDASQKMVETSKDISEVIEQMESGLEMQAVDAKQCLDKMGTLEEKVEKVHDGTKRIADFMESTIKVAEEGLQTIGELEGKSRETTEITQQIISNIGELEAKSKAIGGIAAVMNEIADQTNLLSLNASIEAARAGESGRGFAVVAEEIGKLATASMNSSQQIDAIIREIQAMTNSTAVTAGKAENIVSSQGQVLNNTVEAFTNITKHIEGLNENVGTITGDIADIREAKDVTLEAVENITSVLEEIAATAEEVKNSANLQLASAEKLNKEAECLNEQSTELQSAISSFRIE